MIDQNETKNRKYLLACVFTVDLLVLSEGIMLSWTSPVLPKLEKNNTTENPLGSGISYTESSWIGSLFSLGAIVGPFIYSVGAEKFGRKWMVLAMAVPYLTSFLILAFAKTIELYYAARILGGLVTGGLWTVVPTYIAEVSEDSTRGALSSSMNNFEVTGFFLAYLIGAYAPVMWFNIICACFPFLFIILFVIFVPETPQWLILHGREDEAKASLMKLRSSRNVKLEFEEMKQLLDLKKNGSFRDVFKTKRNRNVLYISLALISLQQFSGINVILAYTEMIFGAGTSSITPEVSAILIGVVQMIGSLITPLFVDRYGRRILLLASAIGMLISEVILGVYFYLDDVEDLFWLPIACLVVYMITYIFGFGPLPWTLMSELVASEVSNVTSALTSSTCWIVSFVLTKYFMTINDQIGLSGSFWLFSAFNLVAVFYTYFCVPETKGKSAKEIAEMLEMST